MDTRLENNMGEVEKELFEKENFEEMAHMIVNLNRFKLSQRDYIKKYNKIRKLHSEVLDSMGNYLSNGKYDVRKYDDIVIKELEKVVGNFDIDFDLDNDDDASIFFELFVYKNHPNIPSVTEIYLENNKFKNKDKIKMLEYMNNSYVGLFEVIDVDMKNGYVTYQDVFTKKKFKIIDISMSSTLRIDKKRKVYTYNRIITAGDISYATGIHCIFTSDSKSLMGFIKTHKYNKCCDFVRCLLLYDIYKKDNYVTAAYNHKYGC